MLIRLINLMHGSARHTAFANNNPAFADVQPMKTSDGIALGRGRSVMRTLSRHRKSKPLCYRPTRDQIPIASTSSNPMLCLRQARALRGNALYCWKITLIWMCICFKYGTSYNRAARRFIDHDDHTLLRRLKTSLCAQGSQAC